ncbi:MAG: hypothetical protein OXU23_17760 [Candidatus Poribacteria bacterium]|nr:hypothetical protein [Candidatus Poribacteria bacterium]
MPNRRETTITNELVNILRNMRHGWELETEVNAFIRGNSELDALVIERGREPIGIEAKFATTTNAKTLITQAETRLVHELEAEYSTSKKTLNNVMAILYPDRFKTMSGQNINPQLREANDLQYKLVSTLGDTVGHFPKDGWAIGTVADIANALHVGAIPNSHLEQAAEKMELSINRAAHLLENAITDHRAIGTKIEAILHQEVFSKDETDEEEKLNLQTLRMAALIITDAFVFQSSLAGAEMKSVRSLSQLLPIIDYADVIADWSTILKVNYRPIFEDARELVKALATDDKLVKHVLKLLCEAAKDLVDTDIAQIHELAGIVFQKLITDRKYVKANYTLPESAVLLSTLVLPELQEGKLPKVADFACGTGALLNGVYQRILSLYEQQGGNGRDIHQKMLEENIAGADVMPNATHLTGSALASRYPDIKLSDTRILTAPYGKLESGDYAVGSLELLRRKLFLPTMEAEAEQVGGKENVIVDLQRSFPYGQFDILIQNPPFTKPGADPAGIDGAKSPFQGNDRPKEYTKAMQAALNKKETRFADGQAGLSSYFVELAHRMLKSKGTMGFILPATVLASPTSQKLRDMWATEYRDVIVITIAEAKGFDCAFSADTDMAECIIVATKGKGDNTGRGKFVCLNQRPKSLLEAFEITNRIIRSNGTYRLEDTPSGGDAIKVGEEILGSMLDCPLPSGEGWVAVRVKSMAVLQSARRLKKGRLELPLQALQETVPEIPICQVGDIATLGLAEVRGVFRKVEGFQPNEDGYACLWNAKSEVQRSMLVLPDSRAIPIPNAETKVQNRVDRNSRTHYNMVPRFTACSIIALFTEQSAIGPTLITNVAFENPRHEIPWTLWCNSTLGLFCHWLHSGKQTAGRGKLRLTTLRTLPTLDVRSLSKEALENAYKVFERLKYERMLPFNECDHDPVREELDRYLLTEVLGITSDNVLDSMQTLREILCAEPSIHGGKVEKCNLDAELAKMKLKGIPFPSWYLD